MTIDPLRVGTAVKILNSGYDRAKIAEDRGLLGPNGARVYRVLIEDKPRRIFIEVREDQLEVLNNVRDLPAQGRELPSS